MVASIQPEQRAISAYKHTTHAHTHTHTLAYILINKSAGATRNATDDRCLIWNWRKSYPLMAIKHEYRMLHSWEAITSTKYVLLLFRFVLQLLLLLLLVDSFILLYFLCATHTPDPSAGRWQMNGDDSFLCIHSFIPLNLHSRLRSTIRLLTYFNRRHTYYFTNCKHFKMKLRSWYTHIHGWGEMVYVRAVVDY